MSRPLAPIAELDARLSAVRAERYGAAASMAEAQGLAETAGDAEFLMLRIRCLEATLAQQLQQQQQPSADVAWTSPEDRSSPAQALLRIKALCAQFPDLFKLMFVIAATHQAVPRDKLALAIKQFRRDTDALSKEDITGLLGCIGTSSWQAFDAVLRSRKTAERKVNASLPWGKDE